MVHLSPCHWCLWSKNISEKMTAVRILTLRHVVFSFQWGSLKRDFVSQWLSDGLELLCWATTNFFLNAFLQFASSRACSCIVCTCGLNHASVKAKTGRYMVLLLKYLETKMYYEFHKSIKQHNCEMNTNKWHWRLE